MLTQKTTINGIAFDIKTHIEKRRNVTASIIRRNINIRIPKHLSAAERKKFHEQMLQWATAQIEKCPDKYKPEPVRIFKDGEILDIGGKQYILKMNHKDKRTSTARIVGDAIVLSLASPLTEERKSFHISTLVSRVVAHQRLPELENKIRELNAEHFGFNIKCIRFKNQKSMWGSCSRKGNINISTRLLFAPDDVLEYVCIHELAHLKELNHSERFWALVSNAMPDYKEKRDWLRVNGESCNF